MALPVRQDNTAPASATSPDGSALFPINMASSALPTGATPLASSSGNVAAGAATATLTSAAGRTAYISGFEFMGFGATGASIVTLTITGLLGGTLSYLINVPAGATLVVAPFPLIVAFNPPLAASAVATNIVVSCPSLGAGNLNSVVNAHGYLI